MKNIQQSDFKSVKKFIPENSFYAQELNMPFLLCEGDWILEKPLDLDSEDFQDFAAIIVTGDMRATQIYNSETDGSCGLIVLGDLTAQNIVVGGQEIYVAGNLKVEELYWGDYNHGELNVQGEINIKVFLATDYSYDYERFQTQDRVNVRYHLCDEKDDSEVKEEGELIQKLFEKKCIYTEADEIYGWGSWLDKDEIFKRLAKNKSVLLPDAKIKSNFEEAAKTWLFPNFDVSAENLKRMLNPKYFSLVKTYDPDFELFQNSFGLHDTENHFFRIEQETKAFYIYDKNTEYVFYYYPSEGDYVLWFKVGEETDDEEFEMIDDYSYPQEYSVFQKLWVHWLKLYSKIIKMRQKFVKMINTSNFETIFNGVQTFESYKNNKKSNKNTDEVYYEIKSEWNEGTIFHIYPSNEQDFGRIIAKTPKDDSDELEDYIYLYDNELDRIKLCYVDNKNLLERDFDMFGYYTNALHFIDEILSEIEHKRLWGE